MGWIHFQFLLPVALSFLFASATVTSAPELSGLNDQLAGLNVSDSVQLEHLISQWASRVQPGFAPYVPHARALGELRGLFTRQVTCGRRGTCPESVCCTKALDGNDICCPGTCCQPGSAAHSAGGTCFAPNYNCDTRKDNPPPAVTEFRTTTVALVATLTQTSSVLATTTNWVSSITTSTAWTTVSASTATQFTTVIVTVTDASATPTAAAAKRDGPDIQAAGEFRRSIREHSEEDSTLSAPSGEHTYYLRADPELDFLAAALSKRGLIILRQAVTNTQWVTVTSQQTSIVVATSTNWQAVTSTSWSTDIVTSTSYISASATITSTTTSTTRVPPGFTSTTSSSTSPNGENSSNGESKPPVGTIVGATIGGLVLLIAIVTVIIFIRRRRGALAEQDGDTDRKHTQNGLDMPEKSPGYGNMYTPGRGAAAGWAASNDLPEAISSSQTGSSMAHGGQWYNSPVGQSPVENDPYAQKHFSGQWSVGSPEVTELSGQQDPGDRSGQWYPPQQLDSRQIMEMSAQQDQWRGKP